MMKGEKKVFIILFLFILRWWKWNLIQLCSGVVKIIKFVNPITYWRFSISFKYFFYWVLNIFVISMKNRKYLRGLFISKSNINLRIRIMLNINGTENLFYQSNHDLIAFSKRAQIGKECNQWAKLEPFQ